MPRLLCARVLALLGGPLFGLHGCTRTPPTQFYVLPSPTGGNPVPAVASPHDLTLGVGPVTVPPYLDRPQIVTRASPAKLALADFDHWAGPLPDTIARGLAEHLALLIPTERVVLYPWSRTIDPDAQVTVEVRQFDRDPGGDVVLVAHWSLLDTNGKELVMRTSRVSLAAGASTYEATVMAMGRALETLAQDIAATLRTTAPPAPTR
jgi:uncharacterized lipoprotein YmbA